MKQIAIIRHGRKDGEDIAADALASIETYGIPTLNDLVEHRKIILHLGTELGRTRQTVKAFESWLEIYGCNYFFGGYLQPDPRFGNKAMFAKFTDQEVQDHFLENKDWFKTFTEFDPDFITEVQQGMLQGLSEMAKNIEDDTLIIIACHTPMIEWLAYALDH